MSEQRFKLSEIYSNQIIDTGNCVNNGTHCRLYDLKECVDLLNEQQATIQSLKEENEELKRKLEYCEHEHFLDSLGSSNKWFGMGGF